jgi:predicted enzyme related to lactoylglutathione lyase
MAGFNGIAWFEIGTDDLTLAEKFYGEVLGWTIGHDDSDGPGFHRITAGDGAGLHQGGLFETGGALPGYAVFGVLVEDVAEACRRVEAAGGSFPGGARVRLNLPGQAYPDAYLTAWPSGRG